MNGSSRKEIQELGFIKQILKLDVNSSLVNGKMLHHTQVVAKP